MPTLAPERAEELVAWWLDDTVALDDVDNPAGPLFLGGKHVQYEITATGGPAIQSKTVTGCATCTGSICNGLIIQCA